MKHLREVFRDAGCAWDRDLADGIEHYAREREAAVLAAHGLALSAARVVVHKPAAVGTTESPGLSATKPWVDAFGREMEAKLAENRHKGDRNGWAKDRPHLLAARLLEEVDEVLGTILWPERMRSDIYAARWFLEGAVRRLRQFGPFTEKQRLNRDVVGECADVANFAMMIADVAGGLRP